MESSFSQKQLANTLVALQFGLLGLLFLVPTNGEQYLSGALANLLTICALLIGAKALYDLRRSLRINPIPSTNNMLATVGIYRIVRHPMYVSVLGIALSSALSNFTLWRGLELTVLLVVLITKSRFEDRLLRERHGQTAKDYQKLTGAFLPRVLR